MGLIKRFERNIDPKVDREFDNLIKQVAAKGDIKIPFLILDMPITDESKSSMDEGQFYFNKFDNALYLRAGDNLFKASFTIV